VVDQIRRAGEFGVRVGAPHVDLAAVVERKDEIVEAIRTGAYRSVDQAGTVDLYPARGHFTGPRRLRVDGTDLHADRIFLATGLRTVIPTIDGLDTVPYLTSRTALDLRELPEHLIVIGGGYIGCEFAQMFRRFGSRVTIVQRAAHLLPREDPDICAAVTDGFVADGVDVLTGTSCVAVHRDARGPGTAGGIRVHCDDGTHLVGSHLLIAAGRTPNTDDLGLEHLGLEPDERGFLRVDDTLHTPSDDVWAIGDIRGGPMFTHTARHDADIAYRTVFHDQTQTQIHSIANRVVPHGVFLDPEVGAVGLTEPEARTAGYDVTIGRQDFASVVRGRAISRTRGLIKFVVDAATDHVLGCHIAGPQAAELVHEAVIAMHTGARYSDIAAAIHIHPTLAEGVNTAAGGVHREIGT
jgi:pyruvate/2-oxoglutarate dehydrogenase complex dihydrolipoamide dehydrogenase (E3) component